jgi:adenosylcobinamide-phosphate synthase
LLAGVALDLALGDPRRLPHPVRGIGRLAKQLERLSRATGIPLRAAGVLFWVSVLAGTILFVWLTVTTLPRPYVHVYWIFSLLAIRDLDTQSFGVIQALRSGDLAAARYRLSRIVGRDTDSLDEPEIVRGAIETVAENLCDAVVAPLFYLVAGGPVGMAAYKAINTLDSMVGHRNERYHEFGWFSARADDVANFLPARLTAGIIWIVASLPGFRWIDSIRVTLRDGTSQPSPNAGFPEAAAAGALGVRLGGLNFYDGVPSRKPFLGDARRPLIIRDFWLVRLLLYATSMLAVVLGGISLS